MYIYIIEGIFLHIFLIDFFKVLFFFKKKKKKKQKTKLIIYIIRINK